MIQNFFIHPSAMFEILKQVLFISTFILLVTSTNSAYQEQPNINLNDNQNASSIISLLSLTSLTSADLTFRQWQYLYLLLAIFPSIIDHLITHLTLRTLLPICSKVLWNHQRQRHQLLLSTNKEIFDNFKYSTHFTLIRYVYMCVHYMLMTEVRAAKYTSKNLCGSTS